MIGECREVACSPPGRRIVQGIGVLPFVSSLLTSLSMLVLMPLVVLQWR